MAKKISSSEMRTFRQDALAAHNRHRDDHGVPVLRLDDALCKSAQKWAEQLIKSATLKGSATPDCGENISSRFNSATTEYSGTEVTDYWYKEIEEYDFKVNEFKQGVGNFTQMVWKGSREFGIGKAISKEGKVIVVGQYKPAGNYRGQFKDNVLPPKKGVKISATAQAAPAGRGRSDSSSSSRSSDSSSDDEKSKDESQKLRVPRREQKKFQKEALEVHNEYRSHHKVKPLVASRELNRKAKEWAKHLAKKNLFEHSNTSDTGENVGMHYSSASTAYSGKEASDHWYSEMSKYNFKASGYQKGAGQFTQMVWKDSKEFGIGKAINEEGKVIMVAQYRPAGNYMDHFDKNVFKRDDGYVPPAPQTGPTRVTRTVKSDGTGKEIDETAIRVGKVKLDKADTNPKDLREYRKDLVKVQNDYRKKHGAAKLKESPDLMMRAQKFAAYLAENDLFQNSTEEGVGENIGMTYNSASTEFSGQQCADMWYKQVEKYNFRKPEFTKGAGHFTQMVWQDSKEFGAGKAITREGKVILIGFYKPPGNVRQQFEANVKAARK